ncbi:MAG: anion permease [Schaedlerella sp.]|uniref:SLC13 family permease n=1 Tax=Schaedlerella sp. TaxID=2676057 RepID=UPI00265F5063|nr:anion permease [uncultured Schaedlerella sp.]
MMGQIVKQYILPDRIHGKWLLELAASLAVPLGILVCQPIGLTLRQSAVAAGVLLTIIWWSSGLVKKIPASLFLILLFALVSGTGYRTVLAFPLSETFPMIMITYVFSQAISNSGLVDHLFQPVLLKLVHTPWECVAAIIVFFYLTMYVVPQPLARLIIAATMFEHFFRKTTLPEGSRTVLMYGVFLFYAVVNMSAKDADMIMNHVAAGYSEVPISNGMWMYYMFPPTAVYCVLVAVMFILLFRKDMRGIRLEAPQKETQEALTGQQKAAMAVILAAVALWMTEGVHEINSTLVTIAATAVLFGIGILHREDWKAIDVTTLIFLTAAFSIGGVMKSCGAADKIFGLLSGIFPAEFSVGYLLLMVSVSMLLHMVLGSNTTTLSVAVPGMMILCGQAVSSPVIVFTAVFSVSFHALLPFHSVAMMIGSSNGYFPAGYVLKTGIFSTILVYFAAVCVYFPYWKLTGLL